MIGDALVCMYIYCDPGALHSEAPKMEGPSLYNFFFRNLCSTHNPLISCRWNILRVMYNFVSSNAAMEGAWTGVSSLIKTLTRFDLDLSAC